MTVLVTGATGNVGSAAVAELRRRGARVRAFVRRPVETLGEDVELAIGDFEDPASIRAALAGVDRVLLSSPTSPRQVEHDAAVIDAAAGVDLLVKVSALGARPGSALPGLDWNGRSEERLRASGMPGASLRAALFMTNLLAAADPVRMQHILPAPAGDERVAMIDPRDVVAAAAAVLTGDGHEGRTYELTGPEAVTYREIADLISRATGTRVEYVDVPPPRRVRAWSRRGCPTGWSSISTAPSPSSAPASSPRRPTPSPFSPEGRRAASRHSSPTTPTRSCRSRSPRRPSSRARRRLALETSRTLSHTVCDLGTTRSNL
jgi:uncharacterized protein YbjT (DUF2867 family)